MLKKINSIVLKLSLVLVLTGIVTASYSQSKENGQLRMTPQEIVAVKAVWPSAPGSSNLSAVQVIVIHGDPSKAGLYTILLKVAPNTKIPAHLHPDERMGCVVSGTWYFGYGDVFSQSDLKKLPVGSVYSEVKDQNHFAMTKNEPVVVQITGYGPSGVTYVNPEDDPQKGQ
ncbi:cupin domain-containing protein [Chitinophaga sp.]|uniref:cupin domain-containing protein n=1 Tax=Chitinophaga sp. TaxID=1869181 RepID=UPI0031CEF930